MYFIYSPIIVFKLLNILYAFDFTFKYSIMFMVIEMEIIQYIIIIAVLLLVAIAITRASKKDAKIEVNKLVDYLGGKDNIISYEVNKSRFMVTLKDISLVNKEGIQKMGAQGMVEIDNQLKIILGTQAETLKKYIDELK